MVLERENMRNPGEEYRYHTAVCTYVGSKQRQTLILFHEMLDRRRRNGCSVERAGAPPELVHDDETPPRAPSDGSGGLRQFDEEGRLAAQDAVARAKPGEDSIYRRE